MGIKTTFLVPCFFLDVFVIPTMEWGKRTTLTLNLQLARSFLFLLFVFPNLCRHPTPSRVCTLGGILSYIVGPFSFSSLSMTQILAWLFFLLCLHLLFSSAFRMSILRK